MCKRLNGKNAKIGIFDKGDRRAVIMPACIIKMYATHTVSHETVMYVTILEMVIYFTKHDT